MKIAAIGNQTSKTELGAIPFPHELEWAWVSSSPELSLHKDATCYLDLEFTMDKARIAALASLLPKPVIIGSVTHTLEEIGYPFIRINAWPGLLGRIPAELAVHASLPQEARVKSLFASLNWPCRIVPDIPGMLSARILATIINEAWLTFEQGVSTKEGIDQAMRLGTNYPFGPFEWSQRIGLANILGLLEKLSMTDKNYFPAKSLTEAATGTLTIGSLPSARPQH